MARDFRNRKNLNLDSGAKPYGEVLRETRERHGISLSEVSQDLHVREDILIAIEDGDFSKIPPQGYSRNMIKSYARLLGLDANRITNMFLDAEYSFQISKKRESAQQISEENKKRVPRAPKVSSGYKTPRQQIEEARQRKSTNTDNLEVKPSAFGGRTVHVFGNKYKNTPRARRELDREGDLSHSRTGYGAQVNTDRDLLVGDDYKSAKERLESRKRKNMSGRQKLSRKDSYELNEMENPNGAVTNKRANGAYSFMNVYQKQSTNNAVQSKLMIPIIAAAVVVLIIILICVLFFVGKQHENDKTDVSKLNVVGISDVENPNRENDEEGQEENVVAEPKEVEFKYKVKDGHSVYMEIYEGNNSRPTLAREVKAGETNTFKVTDTLKFVTSKPEGVEIYVDNELVQPADTKGVGVYNYTVNFKE